MEIKIEVVFMPDELDVRKVAAVAKTAYHNENYIDIIDTIDFEEASKFLKKLIAMGHESSIEPLLFSFNFTGVSRVFTHELRSHRIGSFMQKSFRFKRDLSLDDFIYPKKTKNRDRYEKIMTGLLKQYYKLMELGETPDDARRILPMGVSTEITLTMNARSLRNLIRLRADEKASWEIRRAALDMVLLLIDADLGFLLSDIAEDFNKKDEEKETKKK